MDPEQLARAHLRPEDQAIRDVDIPERLQVGAGAVAGWGRHGKGGRRERL
jgi:transcription elongation factor SPT6